MASRKEHNQQSFLKYGKTYDHVHSWLDEYFSRHKNSIGAKHRKLRHTREGIKEVRKRWGDEAAQAATDHIVLDMQMFDDPMANEAWIADDTEEYVRKGYF